MQTDLPLAAVCGLSVAVGVYVLLASDPFVATAVATVYAAASYFYLAFDAALLGSAFEFTDRSDRVGYALGMFGLSVSPVAVWAYSGSPGASSLPFVVLFLGTIAFLILAAQADRQTDPA
ncbi:hypothetical protein [Halorubrum amylolyticum]|uniref:hypothetical protein n=1 Tax=Halorubrum amylolyticum TaxID=2508724 RepID=UPI001008D6AF|nr:hypothetical protein [Halorubrum amylolyticum]